MDNWFAITALTLMAGIAIPIGAAIARVEHIHSQWLETEFRHSVIAFGGGALLSAIALVLVPVGSERLTPVPVVICFAAGGLCLMVLDILLDRWHSPASQLVAMLTDFIPEALALGATFAADGLGAGFLLACLMALQNLPEGFNAFREIAASGSFAPGRVIGLFAAMALLGPVAGLTGYFWLTPHSHVVGGIMLFAAGGILYIIFQDIAPQARLARHWGPPLGAVAGFLLGLIGEMLLVTG